MKKSIKKIVSIICLTGIVSSVNPICQKAFAKTSSTEERTDLEVNDNAVYTGGEYNFKIPELKTQYVAEEAKWLDEVKINDNFILEKGKYLVEGDFAYINLDENSVAIITYLGEDENVEIPSTIKDKNVTIIGGYTFYMNDKVKNVEIPNTVKGIYNNAFSNSGIEKLDIPDSVEFISDGALFAANKLKTLNIGDGLVKFNHLTNYCDKLENINIDKNNKYFESENGILYNKEKNILVQYPNAKKGEEYTIPENVEYINLMAFNRNKTIKTLNINKNLKVIGQVAFSETNLENVNFPEGASISIEGCAFSWDKNLKILDIKGVKNIGNYAFRECGLEKVSIDSTIERLYNEVFNACSSLQELDIYNRNAVIANDILWRVRDNTEDANKLIVFKDEVKNKDNDEVKDSKAEADSKEEKVQDNKLEADSKEEDSDIEENVKLEKDSNEELANKEIEENKIPEAKLEQNKDIEISDEKDDNTQVTNSSKSSDTADISAVGSVFALLATSGASAIFFKRRK